MTTITLTGTVTQYVGDTPTIAGTATLEIFAPDAMIEYTYLVPGSDFFEVNVSSSEYYSITVNGGDWDLTSFDQDLSFVEVTFRSGLSATYASLYQFSTDGNSDRDHIFELDRDSAAVPDLPQNTAQINTFFDQIATLDQLPTGSGGTGVLDFTTVAGATVNENDFIVSTDSFDLLSFSLGIGDDTLYSNAGRDRVFGGAGNDRLVARGNKDGSSYEAEFFGNSGDDLLKVKFGMYADFDGGSGNDRLIGAAFDDAMDGGSGSDIIIGLDGMDVINGGDDRDFLYGGRGNDTVSGGNGDDEVRGNRGDDVLEGGNGQDDLRGGGNNDTLRGDADDDFLFGESGRDILDGGSGDDVLTGGLGGGTGDGLRDTFVYSRAFVDGGGYDRIKDFENGLDTLDLSDSGVTDFASVFAISADTSAGLRIKFAPGEVLFIDNFTKAEFDATDVIF